MSIQPYLPTCYRHPDRETRLACSHCGRPVCVDCVRAAAVGQHCLECSAPDRRTRVITAAELRAGQPSTPASMAILAISAAVYLAGFLVPDAAVVLFERGAQINPLVAQGQWYRLITGAFLHSPATITHILFNMWALYVFGPQLERQVGSGPFLALYLASALAGGALYYVLGGSAPAVGASGAIFGLFGAWLAASYRNRHTLAGAAGLRQLLVLLAINLALPVIFPAIAWQAHVGGLAAGFGISTLWGMGGGLDNPTARTAVATAVGLAALLVVIAL